MRFIGAYTCLFSPSGHDRKNGKTDAETDRCRGRARYAPRVSRSVVVSVSLSRRNAASESEEKPWFVVRSSWLVKTHHYTRNGLWSNLTAGRPLGVPYAPGCRPFFCNLWSHSFSSPVCDLQGRARAFSARLVMTVRNGKTDAETDRCRGRARLNPGYSRNL